MPPGPGGGITIAGVDDGGSRMRTIGMILAGWVVACCAMGCASEVVGTAPQGSPDGGDTDNPTPPGFAPKVLASSQASGAWGSVYTIEGEDLDRGSQRVAFGSPLGNPSFVERSSPQVVSWTSTKIEVKVPFPADGPVSVGDVEAGAFVSTFAVSKKGLMHGGVDPMAILATRPGELVVASTRNDGAGGTEGFLYRMTADGAEDEQIELRRAALLRDASGPFAVLEDEAFGHTMLSLASPGATPAPATGLPAEYIAGSGTDATGAYVWTATKTTLTRHRLTESTWTADRTISGVYGSARVVAAAADDSITLFTSTHDGGLFDSFDNVYAQVAAPGSTQLEDAESIVSDMDDSTFNYRAWTKSGGRSVVRFCATDERGVEFDGRACFYWSRESNEAQFEPIDFVQIDGNGPDAASATCEDDALVVTAGGVKTTVLSPCRHVAAFTRDPDGKPALLIAHLGQYHFVFAKE